MNPNARTLQYLREEGWQCAPVEKWMKFGTMQFGRRVDVWGFGDILACHRGDADTPPTIALVQACAGGDHGRRKRKMLGQMTEADMARMNDKEREEAAMVAEYVRYWKRCDGGVILISWAKRAARGDRRKVWTPKLELL